MTHARSVLFFCKDNVLLLRRIVRDVAIIKFIRVDEPTRKRNRFKMFCARGSNSMSTRLSRWTLLTGLAFEAIPLADRKSTRLNSSHTVISYAVFCLKKKKT